jgi:hypothetical protein
MIEVKEKMDQLLNENTLVELAEERAKEIIDEAEKFADDIKESGYEYVENLLNNLGLNLQDMMGKVESNIKELTNYK